MFFYNLYKYLVFFPLSLVSIFLFGMLSVAASFFLTQRCAARIFSANSRFIKWIVPIKVVVHGADNIKENESYLLIANHKSNIDPIVLNSSLSLDLRFVMKQELRLIPFFGYICERVGYIVVDRSDRERAIKSINDAKSKLVKGASVVFFPEGTRHSFSGMLPFKKGAFHFALDTSLPILPVTIAGSERILPKGTIHLAPGRVDLYIHKPLPTDGMTKDSLEDLMEKCRGVIESRLNDKNSGHTEDY